MKWTDNRKPTEGVSFYDHTKCETPIGTIMIEWKSWKDRPSYDIGINGEWIGCEYSLDEAKKTTHKWLKDKAEKLTAIVNS